MSVDKHKMEYIIFKNSLRISTRYLLRKVRTPSSKKLEISLEEANKTLYLVKEVYEMRNKG